MTTNVVTDNTGAGAAFGSAALAEAILGLEFVIGGLNKYLATNFAASFKSFVDASVSTHGRVLTPIVQVVIIPNSALFAELARLSELAGGLMLLFAAGDTFRRQVARTARGGAFETWVSVLAAVAALALGGLSLTIYLLKGGTFPVVDTRLALAPPVQVELVNVALALAVVWFGIGRFLELRRTPTTLARKWHPRWLVGLVLLASIVSLAACGGSTAGGQPAGSIRVDMTDYQFSPGDLDVKADAPTFYLVNGGGQPHDMVIADAGGHVIAKSDLVSPGDAAIFTVSKLQPGVYAIYCDVPGHRESGMAGTLKVRGTSG